MPGGGSHQAWRWVVSNAVHMIPEVGTDEELKDSLLEQVTVLRCVRCQQPVVTRYKLKEPLCAACVEKVFSGWVSDEAKSAH